MMPAYECRVWEARRGRWKWECNGGPGPARWDSSHRSRRSYPTEAAAEHACWKWVCEHWEKRRPEVLGVSHVTMCPEPIR